MRERRSAPLSHTSHAPLLPPQVHYWERLHFEIPYVAMDISAHRERYRCLRENVMLVVRDYNSILHALSPQDRRLFSERLHYLDRKIAPGLTKLSWASKGITEVFVKDVRRHCGDVWRLVQTFDSSKRLIGRSCRMVATTSLVLLKKKNIYAQEMFEEEQSSHQRHVMHKFGEVHAEVKGLMQKTYETFRTDGDEVQREWAHFVENVDRGVEESLRTTVKRSLQELSRDPRSHTPHSPCTGEAVAAGAVAGDQRRRQDRGAARAQIEWHPTELSHSHPRSSHFHRSAGPTPLQNLRHSPELEGRVQAVDPRAHPNGERRREGGDLDGR